MVKTIDKRGPYNMKKNVISIIREILSMLICFLIGLFISRSFFHGNAIVALLLMLVLNFLFTLIVTTIQEYLHPGTIDYKEKELQARKDTSKELVKKAGSKLSKKKK